MTKLVIQIPCFNEAESIAATLRALPRTLPGIDDVVWLIVDDGSTDDTVARAIANGADRVVQLHGHRGLAHAFTAGLEAALALGADIIVNTDADNQYCADDIGLLVQPIIAGQAEMVVGARPIDDIAEFSAVKKALQRLGSWAVRVASRTDVQDAPSGFRAISRTCAQQIQVFGEYTYTIETIIQAGQKGMRILSVPVRTNGELRPSRLIKSLPDYILHSVLTIGRIFAVYRPFRMFCAVAALVALPGVLLTLRYGYFWLIGEGAGHVQSVVLGSMLLGLGAMVFLIGVLADLIATNRKLLEKLDWRLRRLEEALPAADNALAAAAGPNASLTPFERAARIAATMRQELPDQHRDSTLKLTSIKLG